MKATRGWMILSSITLLLASSPAFSESGGGAMARPKNTPKPFKSTTTSPPALRTLPTARPSSEAQRTDVPTLPRTKAVETKRTSAPVGSSHQPATASPAAPDAPQAHFTTKQVPVTSQESVDFIARATSTSESVPGGIKLAISSDANAAEALTRLVGLSKDSKNDMAVEGENLFNEVYKLAGEKAEDFGEVMGDFTGTLALANTQGGPTVKEVAGGQAALVAKINAEMIKGDKSKLEDAEQKDIMKWLTEHLKGLEKAKNLICNCASKKIAAMMKVAGCPINSPRPIAK